MVQIKLNLGEVATITLEKGASFIADKYNLATTGVFCQGKWDEENLSPEAKTALNAANPQGAVQFFPYQQIFGITFSSEVVKEETPTPPAETQG